MAYLKDVSSLCCVQQQKQQCVLRLFLFVVLLNLFCQMEAVEVIISKSCVIADSCNCSDFSAIQSGLPVMCPNLSYAQSIWAQYQLQELTFILKENQYLQENDHDFFLKQVHNVTSLLGNDNRVHCSGLIHRCHTTNSHLVIANTVFHKCQIEICSAWGHLVNVTFLESAIEISDSINLTIESCVFLNCSTYAILLEINIDRLKGNNVSIVIRNTSFISSHSYFNPARNIGYGLLCVSIDSYTSPGSVEIMYDQLHFERNNGTLLNVFSYGYSKHTMINCTFSGNLQTKVSSAMVSFNGNPNYCSNSLDRCGTSVTLTNITIIDAVYENVPFKYNHSIFFLKLVDLIAENLALRGSEYSTATMMVLDTVNTTFIGDNTFQYNQGVYGGALSVINNSSLTIAVDSVLTFTNNYAYYGGAIYFDTKNLNGTMKCQGKIIANNNHARVAGDLLYSTSPDKLDYLANCFNSSVGISTAPKVFNISDKSISLIPGQIIKLNVTLTDGFGQPASCKGQLSLLCINSTVPCENGYSGLWLTAPIDIFLHGKAEEVNTLAYIINDTNSLTENVHPSLNVSCFEPIVGQPEIIKINWTNNCPLGFTMTSSKICTCSNNNKIRCTEDGIACIQEGLWTDGDVTISCLYPLCDTYQQSTSDRSITCRSYYGQSYVALSQTKDEQCAFNRGGRRCSGCRQNYFFTFGGIKCTDNCEDSYPYLITLFAFIFQFLIFVFMLVAIRLKLEIGSGYLYGPLLFLAIIGQMQFGYYDEFRYLKIFARTISSIFLVNLEVFGEIPWCFGRSLNLFTVQSLFYYLGPFLIWAMLLLLVVISRCCSRLLSKVQDSPIQAICLLIMLSFWSVANTSIQLLIPIKLDGEYYTNVDPSVRYFHDVHIPVALVSIGILSFVILPFVGLLIVSNSSALYYVFRLYRFKPILDEFQSCYQDKYRWYSVVYYIFWILYLVLVPYPAGPQVLLVLLLTLHFIIQPYKRHILNVIDMLLLLDLLFLTSLLNGEEETENKKVFHIVLIYVTILLPLVYVIIGSVSIFVLQCRYRICKNFTNTSVQHSAARETVPAPPVLVSPYNEREPLIRILQND